MLALFAIGFFLVTAILTELAYAPMDQEDWL